MKKIYEIENVEDLKLYIATEKDIDYGQLVRIGEPINHDFIHNSKALPLFEYLLENIPNLWIKVKHWEKEIYLAQQVVGIINHYAKDKYWDIFTKKLGEHINFYDKSEHKNMWTYAMLKCSPMIFQNHKLHNEIKKSIGEKELDNILLGNISEFSMSCRYETESAITNTPKEEMINILKQQVVNENFYAVLFVMQRSKLAEEDIKNIKVEDKPIAVYLQEKRQEYTLSITGEPIKKGSHTKIDKIFRKNLCNKDHDYRLNYFNLDKVMFALDISNTEITPKVKSKKKLKA